MFLFIKLIFSFIAVWLVCKVTEFLMGENVHFEIIGFSICKNVRFEVHSREELCSLLLWHSTLALENNHASLCKNKNLIGTAPPPPPPSPPSPIKKIFGLKLIGVLFTVLHAQVLDQTILRSTQQQQSLPHATTILLTERGTTLTI